MRRIVYDDRTTLCELCTDGVGVVFTRNVSHSQFWNEKVWIHVLRMIAMAIDGHYQDAVDKVCTACDGMFSAAEIKGFVRMKNKCISKEDHYYGAYPRLGRCDAVFQSHADPFLSSSYDD